MSKERAAQLMADVNSALGKDAVTLGSDPYFNVTYLPTGIPAVDDLLQGGIPFGRFVEIFGDYSTLKSYVGLAAIAQCQQMGKLAALIDTEHAYDPAWAKSIGVDLESLIVRHPDNGEQAIDTAEQLIRGGVDFIVFDSVAAALPKAEEQTMLSGDKNIQPARLAQLMSIAMRKLTAANRKTAILWINQTRVNVGMMFGNPETVPGGKALPYYASYRISMRKAGKVTEDINVTIQKEGKPTKAVFKQVVGQEIKMTVEKSKLNAPHREIRFVFDLRKGVIDNWWYLVTQALDRGVITYERGLWWVTTTEKPTKHRGKEAFQKALTEKDLLQLLGKDGKPLLDNSRVVVPKKRSSRKSVRVSTPTVAPGTSKRTVVRKKNSSKLKTR